MSVFDSTSKRNPGVAEGTGIPLVIHTMVNLRSRGTRTVDLLPLPGVGNPGAVQRMQIAGLAGLRHRRVQVMPYGIAQEASHCKQGIQVDARFDAHLVEHVDQILGGDVAGRTRGEGAPAQAA